MAKLFHILACCLAMAAPGQALADAGPGLFDARARAEALRQPVMAPIRAACLAKKIDRKWARLKPIPGLKPTDGYGSDNSAEDFSWAVMVLSGRTLAGDADAAAVLKRMLLTWAQADAFEATPELYDPYYALKRQLLPLTTAFAILLPSLDDSEAATLEDWIDPLVRRIDRRFDREVDRNNHRTLADSVLAVWGSIIGDHALVAKGLERFDATLSEIRADGTLPLEARRGSRALWYQRQTLSSLTVIAEVARGRGIDLYAARSADGRGLLTLVGALLDGLRSPILVTVYSAENHIPGPGKDYLKPDLGFLKTRGHGRHYMAWAEAAVAGGDDLPTRRLKTFLADEIEKERPLIDEFAGGNATCFWGQP